MVFGGCSTRLQRGDWKQQLRGPGNLQLGLRAAGCALSRCRAWVLELQGSRRSGAHGHAAALPH